MYQIKVPIVRFLQMVWGFFTFFFIKILFVKKNFSCRGSAAIRVQNILKVSLFCDPLIFFFLNFLHFSNLLFSLFLIFWPFTFHFFIFQPFSFTFIFLFLPLFIYFFFLPSFYIFTSTFFLFPLFSITFLSSLFPPFPFSFVS